MYIVLKVSLTGPRMRLVLVAFVSNLHISWGSSTSQQAVTPSSAQPHPLFPPLPAFLSVTTWIEASNRWRPSVCCWPTRSSTQRTSSSSEVTTSVHPSTGSTDSTTNVSKHVEEAMLLFLLFDRCSWCGSHRGLNTPVKRA